MVPTMTVIVIAIYVNGIYNCWMNPEAEDSMPKIFFTNLVTP
jgi:hypothetical protein